MAHTSAVVLPFRAACGASPPPPPATPAPPETLDYWARLQTLRAERSRLRRADPA